MSKIPYLFVPLPRELVDKEFVSDHAMIKLILYLFGRVSAVSSDVRLKKQGVVVHLEPFEFIYGRKKASDDLVETEGIIRNRMDRLVNLGYIQKQPAKSTNSFSVYKVVVEAFRGVKEPRGNRQQGQQLNPMSCHKREAQNQKIKSLEETIVVSTQNESSLMPESSKELEVLNAYCEYKELNIKPNVIKRWLAKHGCTYVSEHIGLLIDCMDKVKNHEAWMEEALKKNYFQNNKNIQENRMFAEKFKKSKGWSDLKITKQYCEHEPTREQYSFLIRPEAFQATLVDFFELLKEGGL